MVKSDILYHELEENKARKKRENRKKDQDIKF